MELRNNKLRWILLLVLVVVATWKVTPTVKLAMMDKAQLDALEPAAQVELRAKSIKQGLDLQGGMHMVLEVDLVELMRNLARHKDDARFKSRMDRVDERLSALADFWSLFEDEFADVQLSEWYGERRQSNEDLIVSLKEQSMDAIDNSLVILRNRVDGSGLQEPSITKQGQRRIVVELAGVNDPEAARNMIGKTAMLEFKLVEKTDKTNKILEDINSHLAKSSSTDAELGTNEDAPPSDENLEEVVTEDASTDEAVLEGEDEIFDPLADTALEAAAGVEDVNNPLFNLLTVYQGRGGVMVAEENRIELMEIFAREDVRELMPRSVEFILGKLETIGEASFSELFLVDSEAMLTGKALKTAGVNIDQGGNSASAGGAIVELSMTRDGARHFARITGDNIDRRLAIVLDRKVFMAPNIRSKIPNGRAIIEGLDSIGEAKELANLLKHGALPSTVKPVEERTVGPSLGKESVEKGAFSFLLGFSLVILFMMIYYKKSGVFSVVALLLNMLFVMAILAGFGATLTLPGIAGIILTIGMAVDANVLIFERVREELRRGRTVRAAVDAGYAHAFSTIVDANVTTLIAGVVLYQFGSGPIRGFALTLMIGITASMYTAIVVTRLLFDALTDYDKAKRLSI
jgi:SecD/SecF fusion protein